MTEVISYSAAFFLGLLGGVHCIGMCGGIMSALSFAIPEEKRSPRTLLPLLLSYNLGRLISYTLIGALVGLLGWLLQESSQTIGFVLRLFAGFMLIAMGLYLARWWLGLGYLESAGAKVWKYLQPFGKRLMPVRNPPQAILLGAIWGWLPCGLVYSVAAWAASAADWQQSALILLCFGLGTLPVMLITGQFAFQLRKFTQSKTTQAVAACLIILFGVWTIVGTVIYAGGHTDHSQHLHMDTEQLQNQPQSESQTLHHHHQPQPQPQPQQTHQSMDAPMEHHNH